MRTVDYVDDSGYQRRALLRDDDPDSVAPQGIQLGPPPIDELDWEAIKRDLHNRLFRAGLFSWRDVQEKRGLRGAILASMKGPLVYLYREVEHMEE